MENQANNQISSTKAPIKRQYLIVAGIVKAIICALAIIILTKYSWETTIITVVALLFVVDISIVVIMRKGRMQLKADDALFVNFTATAVLCCIAVFIATTTTCHFGFDSIGLLSCLGIYSLILSIPVIGFWCSIILSLISCLSLACLARTKKARAAANKT